MKTELKIYQHAGQTLEAFVAYPENTSSAPCVLIAHAWAGRDEFVLDKAKQLAQLGYVGVALDNYGKGIVGKNNTENSDLMTPLMEDRQLLIDRLKTGLDMAHTLPVVDKTKFGAMGYCFGGLCALDMARANFPLCGVVSFHGLLSAPKEVGEEEVGTINPKILVLHGHDDPMGTPDQVKSFTEEMNIHKANWEIHLYGQTMHAFTNPKANDPNFGTVYDEQASKRSWEAMKLFWKEVFA